MNDFITEKRSDKFPPELLRAWADRCGIDFADERVQFPDECGWPNDFMYFEAGWLARFSVIALRQSVAEMPTVDFASDGEELIRRDDVFALLRAGVEKASSIPNEPDQTKYERDTLIWMLIDITGEPNADLFNEAIAEIKKLKDIREGAVHWVNNAVHFQQQAGELQERLAGSQRLVESQRDTIRKLRSEEWEARKLLEQITDPEPCRLDHHGYCQAHLWVGKGECAHSRAKKLLGETRDITK